VHYPIKKAGPPTPASTLLSGEISYCGSKGKMLGFFHLQSYSSNKSGFMPLYQTFSTSIIFWHLNVQNIKDLDPTTEGTLII
jgi:hypothetical protein